MSALAQLEPVFLDTFENRFVLEGFLTTRTGLHIGAGRSGDPLATDSPVVRDGAGQPFIPGASLKGVVRSAAEALLRRDASPEAPLLWSCNPLLDGKETHSSHCTCIGKERLKEIRDDYRRAARADEPEAARAEAATVWAESCTICRLFGSLALAGRVRFPDLPLAAPAAPLEVRNGVGIDRDKELAAQGVLYDFEAVPPGTTFRLTVILDNARDFEVGLLLTLFQELEDGHLSLGGKATRGLGQVGVDWERMEEITLNKDGAEDRDSPFSKLLSRQRLLGAEPVATEDEPAEEAEAEDDSGPPLPESGDPETWKQLADLLSEMPEIEKGQLGAIAGSEGLTKAVLNDKLALGFEPKRTRKVWDEVLSRLLACGFLEKAEDGFRLAGTEPETEDEAVGGDAKEAREPQLQAVYDRCIGAMDKAWQEAF